MSATRSLRSSILLLSLSLSCGIFSADAVGQPSYEGRPIGYSFIDTFVMNNGGCARALIYLDPRSSNWNEAAPLGKNAKDWTDEDLFHLGDKYVKCLFAGERLGRGVQQSLEQQVKSVKEIAKARLQSYINSQDTARRQIEDNKQAELNEEIEKNREIERENSELRKRVRDEARRKTLDQLKDLYGRYLLAKWCFEDEKVQFEKLDIDRIRSFVKDMEAEIISEKEIDTQTQNSVWNEATQGEIRRRNVIDLMKVQSPNNTRRAINNTCIQNELLFSLALSRKTNEPSKTFNKDF